MTKHQSAGGVLLNEDGELFLIHKISRNEWALPKGTIEEGEGILEAATRETSEESGYANIEPTSEEPFATDHYQFTHPKTGEEIDKIVYYFIFRLVDNTFTPTLEMETEELKGGWYTLEEALEMIKFEQLNELIKKAQDSIK